MQDIYLTFEFEKIKESISEFAKTENGKAFVDALSFITDKEEVELRKNELSEMMSLISRFSYLPITNSADMVRIIEMAKKTALLSPHDLNMVREDILTGRKLVVYFNRVDASYPILKGIIANFSDLDSLESEIKRVITPSLTINDRATPELYEIRSKLKRLESSLNSKVASISMNYSSYLSDSNVTIRDGHFVLPVKTVYKSKVLGIVYDVSDSGNTTFIEPLEIVQINNDIATLKVEENVEIRKILKSLTNLVLLQEGEVRRNNEIIAQIDFISAKAIYALDEDMCIAKTSKEQEIHLYHARHPLIDKKKVVSNDYHLDKDKRIVVISGPNAGGKTVSIKVVGLLTLMNQSGLAIPVKEATLGIFNHIYIDIGDNQSLSDNLSTFSAHMKQIAEIMDLVKEKDLVLLDELGTGTDPKGGEAIALACIKYLEAKRPLSLISSHFTSVKEYAFLSENLENSSLLFDEENLSPTYIYKYAVPGKSYGIEVASRYGLKKEIITEAKNILANNSDSSTSELLNILQKKVEENEKLSRELELEKNQLEKEKKVLENEKERLKTQRENLREEAKAEKDQIIKEAEEKIEEIIDSILRKDVKQHEINEARKELENLKEDVEVITYNEEIKVGDYVSIPSMHIEGRVERIKGKKVHIISNDGISYDVNMDRLHKVEPPKENKVKNKSNNYEDRIDTRIGLELNIIGMRRDEAKTALIDYIDKCIIKRFKQVRIIHGFGNGILRKMVHEYLSTLKNVTFRLGDINEGGSGATVVIFHD